MRFGTEFRGWLGILRSLRVYHGDRSHHDGLTRLYQPFLSPGDLAFDIGAHVGDRIRVMRQLGARVVAIEPQPRPARLLRALFGRDSSVTILQAAVDAAPGILELRINGANPTVSTASTQMVTAAAGHESWGSEVWNETVRVEATTIDRLIVAHGEPAFIKIDVEGLEDRVLAGLSRPVRVLSFEFTTLQRDVALRSLARAGDLGYRRFNISLGETHEMVFDEPCSWEAIRDKLRDLPDAANSGDVYCFRDNGA
ncbi:FkbM family methyltransferase [Aurantimonas aggregata]|uniref:FkbM family methyltransferase n=1 Tax=Aurantimonas aggregata TaxID=2047720 RepID=A0A6L9MEY2_9HYPH|nr:FkbM family methyltransferase [Aurantimonas aggregata]NDV86178.1 FkbM family methyltransferase [Aurantimonas aggregata]